VSVERIRTARIVARRPGQDDVARADYVAAEEPLEIRVDGAPLAVVMRTPGHDIELAAGLLASEEVIATADDVATIAHCREGTDPDLENVVNVRLSPERASSSEALAARRRAERGIVTSASCGVCGKRTIESLHSTARPFDAPPVLDLAAIARFPDAMRRAQEVFASTGGLHAAAVFDALGRCLVLREDIGRHNSVDKCVGHLILSEQLPIAGAVLAVSGRASFEIIQKALVARIQSVAAVSAPSSLAVELAAASNMGLVGFVRGESLNLYSGVSSQLR
jgi:FdhD protein